MLLKCGSEGAQGKGSDCAEGGARGPGGRHFLRGSGAAFSSKGSWKTRMFLLSKGSLYLQARGLWSCLVLLPVRVSLPPKPSFLDVVQYSTASLSGEYKKRGRECRVGFNRWGTHDDAALPRCRRRLLESTRVLQLLQAPTKQCCSLELGCMWSAQVSAHMGASWCRLRGAASNAESSHIVSAGLPEQARPVCWRFHSGAVLCLFRKFIGPRPPVLRLSCFIVH